MLIKLPNDTSLWARRLALYFSIYALIIGSHLFFKRFDWWHTNVDSARYMLSALVQGEAAIVALVVTLSLVAVQLAAQSYSARVIEVFRKAPDLWILMGIYGFVIFYGLFILKLIETVNPQLCAEEYICLSNLESYISFAYYFGIFAFMALVPYMLKMFEMLKPSTVIDMLAEKITKENILSSMRFDEENPIQPVIDMEKDPIQPIIDIVRGSLMKYDYDTVRYGVCAIENRTNNIFETHDFYVDEGQKISEHILSHLTRVGKLATIQKDEDSTLVLIINLYNIGKTVISQKLDNSTSWIIGTLEEVGTVAADCKLKDAAKRVVLFIGDIGKSAIEQQLDFAIVNAAKSLGVVGKASAEQQLEAVTFDAVLSLERMGKIIITSGQKFEDARLEIIGSLGDVGKNAAELKLKHGIFVAVARSLGEMGKVAAEQGLEDTTWIAARTLGEVGKTEAGKELEDAVKWTVSGLEWIGVASAGNRREFETQRSIEYLEEVGIVAVEKSLKSAVKEVIESLNKILKITKENNLVKATQKGKNSIKEINEAIEKLER